MELNFVFLETHIYIFFSTHNHVIEMVAICELNQKVTVAV